jgi:hypothetical protein
VKKNQQREKIPFKNPENPEKKIHAYNDKFDSEIYFFFTQLGRFML